MIDLSDKTAIIYDHGVFTGLAHALSGQFERVIYHKPCVTAAMRMKDWQPGFGYDKFDKADSFWRKLGDLDPDNTLIIFPDVNDGDLQVFLSEYGWKVWGCFGAEELEINRWETRELLQKLDMPVIPAILVHGLSALEKHLRKNENKWIKLSRFRGDMETWKHVDYFLSKPKLDMLRVRWGKMAEQMEFIVEDDLPDAKEIGYDGWCVRGVFPSVGMIGYEVKDVSLIGVQKPYEELPPMVRWVNAKLAPILKNYGYCGFWSTEIRIDRDGTPYFIDPCCRCGSPPSELYARWVENLGEVMWGAVNGIMVEPEMKSRYGAEILLYSDFCDENWCPIEVPEKIRDVTSLQFCTHLDGEDYVVPQKFDWKKVGGVVGFGETVESACDNVRKNAESLKGFELEFHPEALDEAKNVIEEGMEYGIEF